MFETLEEAQSYIREHEIAMVDLKFCDLWGRWHHVTVPAAQFTSELMAEGVGFDGSSVGFKSISAGDMVAVPDLSTSAEDPFWDMPTLSFICSAKEADTRAIFPYDPRNIALRAEAYMRDTGIADASLWGPEFEFYVFNRMSYHNRINSAFYRVESEEADWNAQEMGCGYTIPRHGGYHAIPPQDHLYNLRARISQHLMNMGLDVKYHHHEVGGPVRDRDANVAAAPGCGRVDAGEVRIEDDGFQRGDVRDLYAQTALWRSRFGDALPPTHLAQWHESVLRS